jgi:ferric-dicitrate binding protein FerR (iron transport regulator)
MAREPDLSTLGRVVAEAQDAELARRGASDLERVRAALLSDVVPAVARRAPWSPARHALVPALVAIAAAIAVVILLPPSGERGRFQVGRSAGRVGAWIAAPETGELPVKFRDGTRVVLSAGGRARVAAVDPDGARVVLERGRARVAVVHGPHTRWLVQVGPYEVVVTGTAFDVSWDPSSEQFDLSMQRGRVRVTGPMLEEGRNVVAGESITAVVREHRLTVAAEDEAPEPAPVLPAVPAPPAEPQTEPGGPEPPRVAAEGEDRPQVAPAAPATHWIALARAGRYDTAVDAAEATGFARVCATASGNELLLLADAGPLRRQAPPRGGGPRVPAAAIPPIGAGGAGRLHARTDRLRSAPRLRRGGALVRNVHARSAGRTAVARSGGAPPRGARPRQRLQRCAGSGRALPGSVPQRASHRPGTAVRRTVKPARLAVVLLLAPALVARAEDRPRPVVTIAVDRSDDEVAVRLRAELQELGFAPAIVQAPEAAPSRELLEANARDRGAVAAFRIARSRWGVEVWIFDRVTNKTVLREVITGEEPDPSIRAGVVATRAVELLRASLIELATVHRMAIDPEVPRAVRELVEPPRPPVVRRPTPALAFALGPALLVSSGGVGPSLGAGIDVGVELKAGLRLGAIAVLPIVVDTIEDAAGEAVVAPMVFGGTLSLRLVSASRTVSPSLRVGVAAAVLRIEGQSPASGLVARSESTMSLLPLLGASVRVGVARRLRIVLGADLGVALPQPAVRFVGRQVAVWGMPVVMSTAALELVGP